MTAEQAVKACEHLGFIIASLKAFRYGPPGVSGKQIDEAIKRADDALNILAENLEVK